MLGLARRIVRHVAFATGRGRRLYRRLCSPGGLEWAEFLRRHGRLHAIGEPCYVDPGAHIPDPEYVPLGRNVRVNRCSLLGHDDVVEVLNRARGTRLEATGKVDLRDNVYVGHGAVVQPGVTVGPNAIVAARALVVEDVPEGAVVGGVPARRLGTVAEVPARLEARNAGFPWRALVEGRAAEFDPALEPELVRLRVAHSYADGGEPPSRNGAAPAAR
jgi:hypothetical protein